jgi:hypothetical protein
MVAIAIVAGTPLIRNIPEESSESLIFRKGLRYPCHGLRQVQADTWDGALCFAWEVCRRGGIPYSFEKPTAQGYLPDLTLPMRKRRDSCEERTPVRFTRKG